MSGWRRGPIKFKITVQVAEDGDVVNDATVHWPAERKVVELGTIALTSTVANHAHEQKQIIFDPIPRLDGIGPWDWQALLAQGPGMIGHSPTRFVQTIFNRVTDTSEPIQIGRIKAKKIWIFGSFDNERVRQRDHGAANDNHECTRIDTNCCR